MTYFSQINADKVVDWIGYGSMGGMLGYRLAELAEDTYRFITRVPNNLPYKTPNLSPKALGIMGALAFPFIAKQAIPSAKNVLKGEYTKEDLALVAGALFAGINLATLPFQKKSLLLTGIKMFTLIGGFAIDGYGLTIAKDKTDFWTQAGMLFLFNFDRQTRQAATHFISAHLNSDFASKMAYSSALLLVPSVAFGATGGGPTLLPAPLAAVAAVTAVASHPYRRFVELMKEINLYEITEITSFPALKTMLRRAVRIVQHPTVDQAQKLIRDADEKLITLARTKFTPQLQELLVVSRHQRSRMDEWTTAWHGRNSANRLIARAGSLVETLEFVKPRGCDPLLSPEIKALTAARVRLSQYQEQAEGLLVIERDLDTLLKSRLSREQPKQAYQLMATRLEKGKTSDFIGIRTQAAFLHRQLPPLPAAPQPRLVHPPLSQIELESLGPRDYLIAEAMALGTNGSPDQFRERILYWDDSDIGLARKIYGRLRNRARLRFVNLLGTSLRDFSDERATFLVRILGRNLEVFNNPSAVINNYEGALLRSGNHHRIAGLRFELEVFTQLAKNPVVSIVKAGKIYHRRETQAEVDQHFRVTLRGGRTIDFFVEDKAGLLFYFSDLEKQLARLAHVARPHKAALILVTENGIEVPQDLLTPHRITQLDSTQLATMSARDFEKIWKRFYAST